MPWTIFDTQEKYHLLDISPPATPKPSSMPHISSVEYLQDSKQLGWSEDLLKNGKGSCPFICNICLGIPRFPVEIISCGDSFCYDCISEFVRRQIGVNYLSPLECPKCNYRFELEHVKLFEDSSKALYRVFTSVEVSCSYGCGHVASTEELVVHEMWMCPKRPVTCPKGCTKVLPDDEMELHMGICVHRNP